MLHGYSRQRHMIGSFYSNSWAELLHLMYPYFINHWCDVW